ncbi:MAG TPA: IclR family transcriptional regulator [Solirubrobacteraceae bacterium]|nr:IclR family transcriptional regulator [Solirubrobacteraceae bacterium]
MTVASDSLVKSHKPIDVGMSEAAVTATTPSSTLARGLVLLTTLSERGQARADELAAAAGLPVSTTYRYLRLMREHGFAVDRAGVYDCGPLLADRSQPPGDYGGLVAVAGPLMERLTHATQETVTLAVRVGVSHVLCVHQTESPRSTRTAFRIGQRLPLHAGAGERVLLAFAPPEVIEMVLIGELERYTANTPGTDELRRRLASTRDAGITTSRSEYVPGALAVAIPVAVAGDVVCSLTVSGPGDRCSAGWQARVKPVLVNAGRALGYLLREASPVPVTR